MKLKTENLSLKVSTETKKKILAYCHKNKVSFSGLVHKLIEDILEKEKVDKKIAKQFKETIGGK